MGLRDVNYWYIIAFVSGAVTIVAALGEWVFRWWESPGDVVRVLAFFVTVLAIGFGASKDDIGRLERGLAEVVGLQQQMLDLQRQTLDLQRQTLEEVRRQTHALEEAVQFFRRATSGP